MAEHIRKIKILTIVHSTSLYGANKSLFNLMEGTLNNIEWIAVGMKVGGENVVKAELERIGVESHFVPFRLDVYPNTGKRRNVISSIRVVVQNFFIAIRLALFVKRKQINFIHSNSSAICLGAYLSFFSGIPHIWHFREFLDKDYNLRYNWGLGYLRFWANKASRICCISNSIKRECVEKRGIKAPSVVIFNGVIDLNDIEILSPKQIHGECIFVIVGLIAPAKNQLEAIKALEILRQRGFSVRLRIVGRAVGNYTEELQHYMNKRNLSNHVEFLGHVNNPKSIFKSSHITLVCSRNEGMGRVTIESMAFGTPVIGYDSAGTSELIENRKNGLLYIGNEKNLADEIEKLMNNESLYNLIRNNGVDTVKNCYTIQSFGNNFLQDILKI